MALIRCGECGSEISDKALACPKCGAPNGPAGLTASDSSSRTRPKPALAASVVLLFVFGVVAWVAMSSDAPEKSEPPAPAKSSSTVRSTPPPAQKDPDKPVLDLSKPVITDGVASVVCPFGILLEKRIGHDLSAATDAATSIFGREEKVEKVGCEEWKEGIGLTISAASKADDLWLMAQHGDTVLLAFRYGLKNGGSAPVEQRAVVASAGAASPEPAKSAQVSTPSSASNGALIQRPGWCDKAGTNVEKMICADDELSALDAKLYAAFKAAEAQAEDKKAFYASSRSWRIEQRDRCTTKDCIIDAYQVRLADLARPPAAVAPGPVPVVPQAAVDPVAQLQSRGEALTDACRSGSTPGACDQREAVLGQLKGLGWCWAHTGQSASGFGWQRCSGG